MYFVTRIRAERVARVEIWVGSLLFASCGLLALGLVSFGVALLLLMHVPANSRFTVLPFVAVVLFFLLIAGLAFGKSRAAAIVLAALVVDATVFDIYGVRRLSLARYAVDVGLLWVALRMVYATFILARLSKTTPSNFPQPAAADGRG